MQAGECADQRATVRDVHRQVELTQARYLHFVRDAIWAVATALSDMQRAKCGDVPGICPQMAHIKGSELREFLARVQFNGIEMR